MELPGVTYVGPEPDDAEVLEKLPADLRRFLTETNGLVAYDGGLHIRGASADPVWHSLRHAWLGAQAFHARYPLVEADDVPFAQDAVGDQWLLRGTQVVRLAAETGELEALDHTFTEFLQAVVAAPVDVLGMHPLLQFRSEGGVLAPGQLLSVYPPFCTKESANGVNLAPVPVVERLDFLAELARQLPGDAQAFRIVFED
jgi:hypothetical protein